MKVLVGFSLLQRKAASVIQNNKSLIGVCYKRVIFNKKLNFNGDFLELYLNMDELIFFLGGVKLYQSEIVT